MSSRYLLFLCLTAALGGLLFGFDTAVISGANLYIQPYFKLSEWTFGFVVSSMLLGCAAGSLLAGKPCDRYGRRAVLRVTAILFILSAVGSGLAVGIWDFMLYRLIGGLAVGAASMVSPIYITEIAPAHIRGRLVSLNQLTIVLGITAAFFSNYFLSSLPETVSWRWMLGVEAVPALAFWLLLFFVPESPRWLVSKNRPEEARAILAKINGTAANHLVETIASSIQHEAQDAQERRRSPFFPKRYMPLLIIGIVLAVLQQVTGINVIMYYAPNIFESIGFDKSSAIFQTLSIGLTMTTFTVIAMFTVDKFGRKPLLLWGSAGMGLFLVLLTALFYTGNTGGYAILACILGYISCFSFSVGPVVWVLIGEIFPNQWRSRGVALATFFLWTANYVVTLTFPYLLTAFWGTEQGFTFLPYTLFCLVLFLFTWRKIPETKDKSLEEIEMQLTDVHEDAEVKATLFK